MNETLSIGIIKLWTYKMTRVQIWQFNSRLKDYNAFGQDRDRNEGYGSQDVDTISHFGENIKEKEKHFTRIGCCICIN